MKEYINYPIPGEIQIVIMEKKAKLYISYFISYTKDQFVR